MRERGILFSDEMVRAILDGRKTQTRRAVKLPAWTDRVTVDKGGTIFGPGPYLKAHRAEPVPDDVGAMERVHYPYGYPGDRLWVREAWATCTADGPVDDIESADAALYRADGAALLYTGEEDGRPFHSSLNSYCWTPKRWRPSIFMPRWASRITLEITEVRAQRLHDITQDDAEAEGITCATAPPIPTYAHLWNRINGTGAWSTNPWVWAITFKRVEASSRAA